MVKISRSAFFSMLVASGAVILADGCGSGTPKNSSFIGAYQSAYAIPSRNETGTFTFTIDVKGRITGTMDNGAGVVRQISGTLTNNGAFNASTLNHATSVTGTLSGTMSGTAAGGIGITVPVTGGNFQLVESGTTSSGSFQVGATPPATSANGYQGFFNGNYNIPQISQSGTTSFTVDSTGNVTGLLTKGTETGLLTGTISSTGNFTITATFTSSSQTFVGTLVKTSDNSTLGNFNVTQGGKTYAGTFSKTNVVTGDSPFKGSYGGTYSIPFGSQPISGTIPNSGENGTISFTVSPAGGITGFISKSENDVPGTFIGAINNDGTFAGTITYNPSPTTGTTEPTRSITGSIATSAVNGKFAGNFVMTIGSPAVSYPGTMQIAIGGPEPNTIFLGTYANPTISNGVFIFNNPAGSPFNNFAEAIKADNIDPTTGKNFGNKFVIVLTMSIDTEGSMLGSWGGYDFNGRVTNDGRVSGSWGNAPNVFPVEGIISHQLIQELTTFTIAPAVAATSTSPAVPASVTYNYTFKAGFAGNLVVTFGGQQYNVYVQGIGGDTTTGG